MSSLLLHFPDEDSRHLRGRPGRSGISLRTDYPEGKGPGVLAEKQGKRG